MNCLQELCFHFDNILLSHHVSHYYVVCQNMIIVYVCIPNKRGNTYRVFLK